MSQSKKSRANTKRKSRIKSSKKLKPKKTQSKAPKISPIPKTLTSDWLGLGIIALLTVYFFHEQLFGIKDFWSNYWADWIEITVPFFKLNIKAVQGGEIPFWNPYAYGGTAHIAEPTSIFFYPVFYLLHYIISPEANLEKVVSFIIILHFFILSVNTYFLGRFLKMSFWARIMAAVSFTFSCAVICKWQYVIVICGMAWFPLVILYYLRLYKSDKLVWSDLVKAGIFLSLTFAGHAQYFFYNVLFLGLVLFLLIVGKFIKTRAFDAGFFVKEISKYSIPLVISVLLLLVQILPTIELIPLTQRESINFSFASDGSFQLKQLLTFLSPHVFGYFKGGEPLDFLTYFGTPGKVYHYWETAYFFGVIPLMLGTWGFYKNYRRPVAMACLITCAFLFLHALGSNAFLFKILFNLPGFDKFRIPSRTLLYPVFLLCIFSGIAIDHISKRQYSKKDILIFGIIVLVLFLGSLFILFGFGEAYNVDPTYQQKLSGYGIRALLMTLAGASFFWAARMFPSKIYVWSLMAVLLVFIDLASPNKPYKNSEADATSAMELNETTRNVLIPEEGEIFRYRPNSLRNRIFKRNQATYNGFFSMDGFYSFILETRTNLPAGWPVDNLMSVAVKTDVRASSGGGQEAYFINESNALPHHRMTYQVVQDPNRNANPDEIDFANTTVLEDVTGLTFSSSYATDVPHNVRQEHYGFSRLKYSVETAQEGLLVLSEYWFPNWKAYLDGKKVEVLKANHFTRGIVIPEGTHEVELKYESTYFQVGKWISLLSLLAVLLFLVADYVKKNPKLRPGKV